MVVSSSDVQWYYSGSSSSTTSCDAITFVPATGSISFSWTWGRLDFINNCPDAKEIINNLHVTIYRKALFIKKLLKLPSERKRPITNRMMLQRATFRGKMARV